MSQLRINVFGIVLFLLGGVVAYVLLVLSASNHRRGSAKAGFLKIGKHKYAYDIGDDLIHYPDAGLFSGIDVFLPKQLPRIYISGDKVDSEPQGRKIAKDITHSLHKNPIEYDIEINEHHLRLIAPYGTVVTGNEHLHRSLITAAKAVTKAVDHHL